MTHARHKAPARAPRLSPRRTDAVLGLAGAAAVVMAVIGASTAAPGGAATNPVALVDPVSSATAIATAAPTTDEFADLREHREQALLRAARGTERTAIETAPAAAAAPKLPATTTAYATRSVNVRAGASQESAVVVVLDPGAELAVTGTVSAGYAEVVLDNQVVWVYAGYLAATKPSGAVSSAACASGSGVESGLVPNAVAVHRAVCARFPGVSASGGLRPGDGGEHGTGHALDIMVSPDLGNQIAPYLQAHAAELGITELIWQQRIWSTERAGDGWRWMEDRGSATANHYDHVHVTVG